MDGGVINHSSMTTITFDTHEFFNELKSAGFSDQQAEVITTAAKNHYHHHAGTS